MEKLRIFERKCLRACLNRYRTPESNYTKKVSNQKLYEEAKIIRIDLFIIKLIRDHWAKTCKIKTNSLIFGSTFPNPNYHEIAAQKGYTPPESFIYFDSKGLIQNKDKIPIIYHYNRRTDNTKILYNTNIDLDHKDMKFKYKLTKYDIKDNNSKNTKKYWWLDKYN